MVDQFYPEPTCGALIFSPVGKLFLMRSHKWKDNYVIPGGHVEVGETLVDALKREVKEETGLEVYDIKFLLFQEFINGPGFYKKKHFIFFDYTCKTVSTEVILNSEGQEYLWVSPKEALKLSIEPYTRTAIEEYLKRNKL